MTHRTMIEDSYHGATISLPAFEWHVGLIFYQFVLIDNLVKLQFHLILKFIYLFQTNLKTYVVDMVTAITTSGLVCPVIMREVFHALKEVATKHFPGTNH